MPSLSVQSIQATWSFGSRSQLNKKFYFESSQSVHWPRQIKPLSSDMRSRSRHLWIVQHIGVSDCWPIFIRFNSFPLSVSQHSRTNTWSLSTVASTLCSNTFKCFLNSCCTYSRMWPNSKRSISSRVCSPSRNHSATRRQ